ncbi:MAG: TatD family hydrolase [Kiritimatiellae bacterium]|nr:TatD family hydrolase [Kiritimatiellia bacterium]
MCEPLDSGVGEGDVAFAGLHPWKFLAPNMVEADDVCGTAQKAIEGLRERLKASSRLGVGEIGLDRLKERTISAAMRSAFIRQLELAAEFGRPAVLHGAKCWGEVVAACRTRKGRIPAFLFHGFSRSGGLIPDIIDLNGFISIGPALLNDHAVNYRELAKTIPAGRILVESDATAENAQTVAKVDEIAGKLAEIRGVPFEELEKTLEENATRFTESLI